jgi:hypothetical protein
MSEYLLTPAEIEELRQKLGDRRVVGCHQEIIDDRDIGGSLSFGLTLKLNDGTTITQRASGAVGALAHIDAARREADQYRYARGDEHGDE